MDYDILFQVFFTITAAAVIVVTILLAVAAIYVISVVRTVRRVAKMAEHTANFISSDLMELRSEFKAKGFSLAAIISFLKKAANYKLTKTSNKKK